MSKYTLTTIVLIALILLTGCVKIKIIDKDASLYRKITHSVAPVQYMSPTGSYRNYCSSFQVKYGTKQYTVTNNHCCERISPSLGPSRKRIGGHSLKLLHAAPRADICVLEAIKGKTPLKLAKYGVNLYEKVFTIGYPQGKGPIAVEGRHQGLHTSCFAPIPPLFLVNCFVKPFATTVSEGGSSGSPILNRYGEVIGVVFARHGYKTVYEPLANLIEALRDAKDIEEEL